MISPTHTRIAAALLALPAMLALGQTQTNPQPPTPKPIHLGTAGAPPSSSSAAARPQTKAPQASIGTPERKADPQIQNSQAQRVLTQSFPVGSKPATPKPATTIATPTPTTAKPTANAVHAHAATKSPETASTLPGTVNRNVIVLDPAHGGIDSGSRIGDSILEKDVTLALAFKLRSLLTARGFNVIMTRDSDTLTGDTPPASGTPAALSLDDRAGIANHARAAACLLLHATGSGIGVHLYSSELPPVAEEAQQLPWLTAQAAWVPQSEKLEKALATALTRARIPLVVSSASVRPVDSLTCSALVVELAPRTADATTINDASYQQRIAEAIATSLIFWQNQVQPPQRAAATKDSSTTKAVQP